MLPEEELAFKAAFNSVFKILFISLPISLRTILRSMVKAETSARLCESCDESVLWRDAGGEEESGVFEGFEDLA